LGEVVRRLSAAADLVMIDAPAVLAGSDIATMVDVVDMVLLAGDARHTTRAQVRAASGQLAHARQILIGCVLVNYGRRVRVVTPPLSLIAGRENHPDPVPRRDDHIDGAPLGHTDSEGSGRWPLNWLGSALGTENGVDQANGWQSPATNTKG
jgi:hypothetical protein